MRQSAFNKIRKTETTLDSIQSPQPRCRRRIGQYEVFHICYAVRTERFSFHENHSSRTCNKKTPDSNLLISAAPMFLRFNCTNKSHWQPLHVTLEPLILVSQVHVQSEMKEQASTNSERISSNQQGVLFQFVPPSRYFKDFYT